jgi:Bacteriophytochrome (light-regulated signal transduction histidine kinase)
MKGQANRCCKMPKTAMPNSSRQSQLVLVLAPTGRDSALVCDLLQQADRTCQPCTDLTDLASRIQAGAGVAVVAEESMSEAGIGTLREWVDLQPPWADFPFIVLTSGGESTKRSMAAFRLVKGLGNVTLLERPLRTVTLLSAVEAALRARERQFEAQAYVEERLRAEAELIRKAQELALSNADLQQFAYVTSHDLQEPLRTIHAYAQLLVRRYKGKLDNEADQFLQYVIGGAERMELLISDLLSYSRIVNLEARPMAPVSMQTALHWAMENLQLAIADTGASITHDELPIVPGDQVLLVQLLQNLLSNSIKYRSEHPPRIHLGARQTGSEWTFSLKDNGIGIAPAYQDKIFGMFKRLHGREIPGTGIGLAICKKIVDQHHGRIWVESTVGEGTEFFFTLPSPA